MVYTGIHNEYIYIHWLLAVRPVVYHKSCTQDIGPKTPEPDAPADDGHLNPAR